MLGVRIARPVYRAAIAPLVIGRAVVVFGFVLGSRIGMIGSADRVLGHTLDRRASARPGCDTGAG